MAKKTKEEVVVDDRDEVTEPEAKPSKGLSQGREKLSLSKEDLAAIVSQAAAGAAEAAIKALKGPEVKQETTSGLMEKAMVGMSDEEKAEFKASFGAGKCAECGQIAVKGRYPCKGKHKQMVVYPEDAYWAKWFQGAMLNGVTYLSNGPGHMITVPAENDFQAQIQVWVDMERTNAQGKRKSHNSGSINGQTGNTSGFNPFNGPGFR